MLRTTKRDNRADALRHFEETTQFHKMKILADLPEFRQVYFGRPGTNNHSFTLTTWGSHLTVTGDVGTYVFKREGDMFSFFQSARPHYDKTARGINPDYWEEKLEATDTRRHGHKTFNEDLYIEKMRENVAEYLGNGSFSFSQKKDIVTDVHEFDLLVADEGEAALRNACEWQCPITLDHPFEDVYQDNFDDFDLSFLWICHAIVWGIKVYDLTVQNRTQQDYDKRVLAGEL